jgi:hypothetical protein
MLVGQEDQQGHRIENGCLKETVTKMITRKL